MRKKKKPERLLLFAVLLSLPLISARAADPAPKTDAVSAVLMEQESRTVLYSHEANRPLPIASITKIMTGLLAVERCDLNEKVVIRSEWLGTEGSNMGLRSGDVRSVKELLYGLMLASGNDAAVALACYMAGDVPTFVQWMNDRAAELGMYDTCFLNPHGLTQEGHRSTARDMGILACAAMENACFAEISSCRTAEVDGIQLRNHNRLLWDYPGALGVKTGYTEAAGRTLVSCAKRDGMSLICVTLNDPADWKDHSALLDWGFDNYSVVRPEQQSWSVPVISGQKERVTLQPAEAACVPIPLSASLEWKAELPRFVYAPCEKGAATGRAVLYTNGEPVYSSPLVFGETVYLDPAQRLNFWEKLCRFWYSACRDGPVYPSTQID